MFMVFYSFQHILKYGRAYKIISFYILKIEEICKGI